jgi:2-polyprenyl-3-methyl-5-hydroxy-6-metoxy-1,4-benzoquinol methylase
MPKRDGAFVPMESIPLAQRVSVDHEFQTYWYQHVGQFVSGKTVLDAGAGMGYGRRILNAAGALNTECYDLVSLVPWVHSAKIEDYPSSHFDFAVAMDVIEHVENDVDFLQHLLRVAREAIFFSTPNWNVFRCQNAHHRREYTPRELRALIAMAPWRAVHFWTGDEHCCIADRGDVGPADDDMCCNFGVMLWPEHR